MTTIQVIENIPTDCIVHETSVDFNGEICSKPVTLMQYDHKMPILAIHLYLNGLPYELPDDVYGNIRLKKKDGTFVYNPVYGCDRTRQIIYVEVTAQITYCYGDVFPTLEIATSSDISSQDVKYSCTGYLHLKINQNPINEHDERSTSEYETIVRAASDAMVAKNEAATAAENAGLAEDRAVEAEAEATHAANLASAAANRAESAAADADSSKADANIAKTEALEAAADATNAKDAAEEAKDTAVEARDDVISSAETIIQLPRQVFRGKHLGNTITDEQLTAIANGSFSGLFIGDYWNISTNLDRQKSDTYPGYTRYTIVDFDYFYNTGYQNADSQAPSGQIDKHHIVVMAELSPLKTDPVDNYSSVMNETDSTQYGYAGCYLRTTYLEKDKRVYRKIVGDINSMSSSNAEIIAYKDYLTTGYSETDKGSIIISGLAWKLCKFELFSEIMVYGTMITSLRLSDMAPYVSEADDRYRVDKTQMALFRLVPATINTFWYGEKSLTGKEYLKTYWLRDMVNAERFSDVHALGRANSHPAYLADSGAPAKFPIRCFFLLTKS